MHRLRGNSCCRCRHVAAIHAADNRSYVGGANEERIRVGWDRVARSRVGDRLGRQDLLLAIAEASILVSMARTEGPHRIQREAAQLLSPVRIFAAVTWAAGAGVPHAASVMLCSARGRDQVKFTISFNKVFDRQNLKCNVYGIESCEFSLSSPLWPRYQCRPVANAFRLRAPSSPRILDHIRTGGCDCQAMWARNVGTPKIRPTCRRRAFKRGGFKILHAERGRTRKRMIR